MDSNFIFKTVMFKKQDGGASVTALGPADGLDRHTSARELGGARGAAY